MSAHRAVLSLILPAVLWAPDATAEDMARELVEESESSLTEDVELDATGVGIRGQLKNLGSFERRALKTALERKKLELDLEPHGKRIGAVHVVNLDVFSEDDGFLQFFNLFHITTKERIIAREILLYPGDQWDDQVVQESRRRLTDISVTALAVFAPVKSTEEGKVDLLVVTRDIFSLRLNTDYLIAGAGGIPLPGFGGRIVTLQVSPSENNFLGLRKQLSVPFFLSLGNWSVGPAYFDPRLAGTRLQLSSSARAIFSRETSEYEGNSSSTVLSYPLWSYRREWGGSVGVDHYRAPIRQFDGFEVLAYDNPDTVEVEAEPVIYDYSRVSASAGVTRSFGYDWKSNFSFGYGLRVVRPKIRGDFMGDETLRTAFERDILPRSERASSVSVGYSFFTPKFVTYRNIDAFSLAEDVRLGPSVSAGAGVARKEIGSENNFVTLSASASYTFDLASDGFLRMSLGSSTRIERGDAKDNNYSISARFVPPRLFGLMRIVSRISYQSITDNENNSVLSLGGDTGLRGYDVNIFRGDTRLIGNVEMRSPPLRIWFTQWGAVAFWDVGHAVVADEKDPFSAAGALSLKNDVGAGLRMLMPQLQPFVFSLDVAYAINTPPTVPGAAPPSRVRLVIYIRQAF